jgi:hypothetical protein
MTLKINAPLTVHMEIAIINDATGQQANATFSMPPGRFHDVQKQREQLAEFVKDHMPDGFRLMTKREWFNMTFGRAVDIDDDGDPVYMNYAMPGGEDFDD